jgi:ankyrin repeat protein
MSEQPHPQPSHPQPATPTTTDIPPEAIALAGKLYDAARKGDMEIFRQALPAGLPANMTNEKGDSLVMLAAYHGQAEMVQLLLQHGGDPNRVNDRGQSPLAGAVFKMEDAVIEVCAKNVGFEKIVL